MGAGGCHLLLDERGGLAGLDLDVVRVERREQLRERPHVEGQRRGHVPCRPRRAATSREQGSG